MSSISQKSKVVFHFQKIEVIFHFQWNWSRLPLKKVEVVFYFQKKNDVVFHFQKDWGRLPFSKNLGRLPFSKKLRSSSVFKNVDVVFHISSSWVKIRLHTKNQLPRLSRTAVIVIIPGVGAATYNEWAATYKFSYRL